MDSLPASSLQRCGPNDSNKVIPLNPYLSTIIGRAVDCVTLNSLFVSRNHLQIYFKDSKWFAVDLNSFNKTFLYHNNATTVLDPYTEYELHHGSMVGFGVIPSVWASKEEFVSDPDFFVYAFLIQDNTEIHQLCNEFSSRLSV